jgi:hypothetical protein
MRPMRCAIYALACHCFLGSLTGCTSGSKSRRSVPVCAVQDCKTGEIIDDGCAYKGKCKECINDCGGGRVAPRNGPTESPFPPRR